MDYPTAFAQNLCTEGFLFFLCRRLFSGPFLTEPICQIARAIHCRAAVEDVYVAAVHLNDSALAQAIWDVIRPKSIVKRDEDNDQTEESQAEEDQTASLASPHHLEAMRKLQV